MRTLRLSLAGTVILALLGGAGGAALAQATDEAALEPMQPAHFTGAWGEVISEDEMMWGPGPPGSFESLENEVVAPFEASDPRISGTWTQVLSLRTFPIDEEAGVFAGVGAGAVRIENQDGAWAGAFDGHYGRNGQEWYRLDGEGAYEGLTAVFHWIADSEVYEGNIIPGVPPDYPGPIGTTEADAMAE